MNSKSTLPKLTQSLRSTTNIISTLVACGLIAFVANPSYGQNYGLLKKIFDPDGAEGDNYGWSVSVSDSVAVVGSPLDDIGTAHVYFRNQGGQNNWGFVQKLEIGDGASGDEFGFSVAVSDTIIVVGAPFQDGGGSNRGAAYVFSKNTGGPDNWGQVAKLSPSGIGSQDQFGYSVTISGNIIAVGAKENTEGTVHIFYKDNGGLNNWGEETVIMASDAASGDEFGYTVNLRDSVLVVGAPGNDLGGSSDVGAAYVFYRDNDNWTEIQMIQASDGAQGDRFGTSVAVDSVTLVVGSPFDDDEGNDSGSAYIYEKDNGGLDNWGELGIKLVGTSTAAEDEFGHSVSVSRDVILVGAPQDDDSGASSGTAFLFRRDQGGMNNWGETQRLQAFDAVSGDQYGFAVDIEGPFLYVGAPTDDDSGINSGSVYIYREDEIICPDFPTVECNDITVYLDNSGVAEVSPDDINAGAGASCQFSVTLSQTLFSCDDIGDNQVTLTLVDLIGNTVMCDATVTVVDTIGPNFVNCPVDTLTVSNNADQCVGNVIWSIPVAQDNCIIDTIVQTDGPAPGTEIDLGIYTIEYVAYDDQGNTDTCSFVLEIVDTQAPFLACPPDLTFQNDPDECDWTSAAGQLDPLIAIDNCEPVLTYTITTSTGDMSSDSGAVQVFDFPVGVNTVCYMITDSSGAQPDTCCFTITVLDTQEPEVDCPEDATIGTDEGVCEAEYTWTVPTPTDNCAVDSMTVSIMFADGGASSNTVAPGDYGMSTSETFPVGENIVLYMVFDTSGNMNSCMFSVTVFDNEDPVLTCPGDVAITTSDGGTGDCAGELTFTHPTPTDNCGVTSFTIQILNPNGSVEGPYQVAAGAMQTREFELGVSTISYLAEDAEGNSAFCSYTVTVTDDENPEFLTCPADTLTIGTDVDNCSAFVNWAIPVAGDNCGVDSVVQIGGPAPGSELDPGFYTITYVAYDGATPPNTDTCEFVINVVDTQFPLILCPSNDVVVPTDADVCTWSAPEGSLTPTVAIANCPYEITWAVFKDDTLQASGLDDVSGNHTFNLGTSMVCYYITETEDLDGNGILTDTCCFYVIVEDTQAPEVTCPPNTTFQDTDDMAEDCQHTMGSTALDAMATDNCSVISLTHDYDSEDSTTLNGAVFPVGVSIITWTAVDTAGNIETCSFTVTVLDNVDPFIDCPADTAITTSAGGEGDCAGELEWTHPTPTDNCGVTQYNYTITNADGTQSGPFDMNPALNPNAPAELFEAEYNFQLGTSTVSYFAADAAGNTFDCSFTVTVTDDENPQFVNCPVADTLTLGTDVDNCSGNVLWSIPIAEDNCEVTVTQIAGPMPGDELAPGFYTITYLAEDGSGNTDTCEFVLNLVDTQEPLILCPSNDVVVSADDGVCSWTSPEGSLSPNVAIANCPYNITWEVFKSDTLQGSGTDDVSGYTFDLDTSFICYYIEEAEDPDSNGILRDTCCFMVIVQDNESPMVFCPADVTFNDSDDAAEDCQHTLEGSALDATASDNCSVVNLYHDYDTPDSTTLNGAVFPVGITLITWTAVDTAGNIETCSFVVTVLDDINPEVVCPEDAEITTSNNGSTGDCLGEYDWTHPSPTDNCAVTQYNYRIINSDGTIAGPFDLVPLLNPNAPAEEFEASYNFQLDTSVVEYYVEDAAGNIDTCTFTVIVTDDEAPEFLTCPPDTLNFGNEVDLCGAYANYTEPIAEDNCEVEVTLVAGPAPGEFLAPGFYTVIWVAADPSGNTDTCEFVIRILDTQIPDVECPSNEVIVSADPATCEWISDDRVSPVSAFDNCEYEVTWTKTNPDGSVDTGFDDVSGEVFALDTTLVCYIITETTDPDSNGIMADTCCFLVIVQDTENPAITCPEDQVFQDTDDEEEDCQHTVSGTGLDATATDNCSVVSLEHDYSAPDNSTLDGAVFPVGETTVTWTATDTAGNTATCSFTVTVEDNVPPSIVCPPDTIIPTSVGGGLECLGELEWAHAQVDDNCNIEIFNVTYTNPDGTTDGPDDLLNPPMPNGDRQFAAGVTTVSYFVQDSTGNTNTCSFTVTVEDDEIPIFVNCPDTISVGNDPSQCGAFVNWPDPIAVDNCNDTLPVVQIDGPPSGSFFNVGEFVEITYQATDDEGNSVECTFIVTVFDTEIPTAICQDTTVYLDAAGLASIMPSDIDGGSTDNCGVDSLAASVLSFDCDDVGDNNVVLSVYDAAGNIGACVAEVTVLDTFPPSFECPADTMISVCEQYVPDLISGLTGTDNCTDVTFSQNPVEGVQFFVLPGDTFFVQIIATDEYGNTTTCEVGLEVFDENCSADCIGDVTPPEWINCPRPPINVSPHEDQCETFVNFSLPVALDDCEVDTILQIDSTGLTSGDMFPVGLTILKWVAIDVEGNISDTCSIKIFVNDQQPPQLLCPDDVEELVDLGSCGVNIDGISPIALDNCLTAVTWFIYDTGKDLPVGGGAGDVSSEEFGCGQFEVTYMVSDQPIILISEITHELEALNGGTDPVPPFIQTDNGDDFVEVTNYGPTTMDLSCLVIERVGFAGSEIFVVPEGVILEVGDVLTLHYGEGTDDFDNRFFNVGISKDYDQNEPCGYVLSIDTIALDVAAVNGYNPVGQASMSTVLPTDWTGFIFMGDGGSVYRQWAWDSNNDIDFALADLCMPATIGSLNPNTDLLEDNGMTYSLQSLLPNKATCTFNVVTQDAELPRCGEFTEYTYDGPGMTIPPGTAMTSVINVPDNFVIGDVNIEDLIGTHGDVSMLTVKVSNPTYGSLLFADICPASADFNVNFDEQAPNNIGTAPCGPLGGGGTYSTLGDLDVFTGDTSMGEWTLIIANKDPEFTAVLEGWTLVLSEGAPYSQGDTTLENDPGQCGAEFTWMHPVILDNCGPGELFVEYSTQDGISVPEGGEVVPGSIATEFFGVGTTTVTYILTDKVGNEGTCSFDVTVLDVEIPVLMCPNDFTLNLGPGECANALSFLPEIVGDNCGIDTVILDPPSGTSFPIGTTTVTIIAIDENGNSDTCTFDITVIEYTPVNPGIACNDTVNISLDQTCMAEINADMILEGDDYGCYDDFCVVAVNQAGDTIVDNILTIEDVGQFITVTVTDCQGTGNTCWGVIRVEDKIGPVIECPPDITVQCNESTDTSITGVPMLFSCELAVDIDYDDDVIDNDECGEPRVIIFRTWTVTDESGNSATCVQTVTVNPFTFDLVEFPPDYIYSTAFECEDVLADPSLTEPSNTGYPTINGQMIFGDHYCEINVGYWDEFLQDANCPSSYELLRNWIIRDYCQPLEPGVNPLRYIQSINVKDRNAPVLNAYVDADPNNGSNFECTGVVHLGATPYDGCSDVSEVDWRILYTEGGLTQIVDRGTLPYDEYSTLDLGGSYWAIFEAEDGCHNFASDTVYFDLPDIRPPVALCDEHTVVSLTEDASINNGLTKVPAITFDDGSYDNCGEITFHARRMTSCIDFDWTGPNGEPDGIVTNLDRGLTFSDKVPFACCDAGADSVMVQLRVTDQYGNVNFCMIVVEVQDKLNPLIICPPDVAVSCDFWFDAHETNGFVDQSEDPLTQIFGRVLDGSQYEPTDRLPVIIDDPGRPSSPSDPDYLPQPYVWGIDGWADDNCEVDITVRVRIFDDCSGDDLPGTPPTAAKGVRLIQRTFLATDGEGRTQTCTQDIWVVDFDPFYISDTDCTNKDRNDGVIWPCDEEYTFCPQNGIPVNYPTVFDDNCSLIGVTFEDERFDIVDGACYKILRHWTIIDWCQYDAQEQTGIWTYTQVIKVTDDEPTAILGCYPEPITRSVLDNGISLPANNQVFLGESNPLSTSCSVHVTDTLRGLEYCSPEVTYDVKIYPFNGSEFLQIHNKKTVPVDTNGFADLILDTKTSNIVAVRLNGLPYNNRYCDPAVGGEKDYHRVLWTVEDGCGNTNTCSYLMRLEDRKAPSPVCVGLSSVLMPSSGEITIWAADFNASSFDDCTSSGDLLYSFSGTSYEPSRSFTCLSIEENGSPQFIIEIWAADEGNDLDCNGVITWDERNKDYCTTFIFIDDNDGVCPGSGSAGGLIETEELEPVEQVNVNLSDPTGTVMQSFTTLGDGFYWFVNPLLDYVIEPKRSDDATNGVTTLDLVRIQKHLLGLETIESPYKLIAADANNSGSVSAIDLVEIRKLILGLYNEYPKNESWRFVDADFEFADETNPWPFDEIIELNGLMALDKNFVAIKVGDVNGSVVANATQVETRSTGKDLVLTMAKQEVAPGQEVVVDVTSANFSNMMGFQLTLAESGLKLKEVRPGVLDVADENVAVHRNAVTMSWFRTSGVTVGNEDVLFSMVFEANVNGRLEDLLTVTSGITPAEAYDGGENVYDVTLRFEDVRQEQDLEFALFQNEPNPFNEMTIVGFSLPEAMEATLTIYNSMGSTVYQSTGDFNAGYNTIEVRHRDLGVTGVLYYRLDAGDFNASKKMLLVQ